MNLGKIFFSNFSLYHPLQSRRWNVPWYSIPRLRLSLIEFCAKWFFRKKNFSFQKKNDHKKSTDNSKTDMRFEFIDPDWLVQTARNLIGLDEQTLLIFTESAIVSFGKGNYSIWSLLVLLFYKIKVFFHSSLLYTSNTSLRGWV